MAHRAEQGECLALLNATADDAGRSTKERAQSDSQGSTNAPRQSEGTDGTGRSTERGSFESIRYAATATTKAG